MSRWGNNLSEETKLRVNWKEKDGKWMTALLSGLTVSYWVSRYSKHFQHSHFDCSLTGQTEESECKMRRAAHLSALLFPLSLGLTVSRWVSTSVYVSLQCPCLMTHQSFTRIFTQCSPIFVVTFFGAIREVCIRFSCLHQLNRGSTSCISFTQFRLASLFFRFKPSQK